MLIAVLANNEQWEELTVNCDEKKLKRITSLQDDDIADAYIILDEIDITSIIELKKPVMLNDVINTLTTLKAGQNVVRINGWNGFLQRKKWEMAGVVTEEIKQLFAALDKDLIEVADEPGLVAARTISMIINEAYFALGEEVSTKEEIDIAMKLGTNYPYGPFEWANKIGVKNIYELLKRLYENSSRYIPAPLLEKEVTE